MVSLSACGRPSSICGSAPAYGFSPPGDCAGGVRNAVIGERRATIRTRRGPPHCPAVIDGVCSIPLRGKRYRLSATCPNSSPVSGHTLSRMRAPSQTCAGPVHSSNSWSATSNSSTGRHRSGSKSGHEMTPTFRRAVQRHRRDIQPAAVEQRVQRIHRLDFAAQEVRLRLRARWAPTPTRWSATPNSPEAQPGFDRLSDLTPAPSRRVHDIATAVDVKRRVGAQ